MSIFADPKQRPPLDESFYSLRDEEAAFFKSQTGIQDDEELKMHIIDVQKKAYQVYGYPCIRRFSFTRSLAARSYHKFQAFPSDQLFYSLRISRLPAYQDALKLGRERDGAILLDIGCCFGNDVRKAVADGWPVQNAIGSDLRREFWDYGHELFKTTPATFSAAFIDGDAFDPTMIVPRQPFYEEPETPRPDLRTLSSLTPLQGHISVIHASYFFHLFSEERQLLLARQLASLLSSAPGSIIFGCHVGRPEKGFRTEVTTHGMFCHNPDSWMELWDGVVFKKGSVHVDARLKTVHRPELPTGRAFFLIWSVTRL